MPRDRQRRKVELLPRIKHWHWYPPRFTPNSNFMSDHIANPVESQIRTQVLKHQPLRFKGNNTAAIAHHPRKRHCMSPNIRPNIQNDIPGLYDLSQQFNLRLTPLAVQLQRSPHKRVVTIEKESAVSTELRFRKFRIHKIHPSLNLFSLSNSTVRFFIGMWNVVSCLEARRLLEQGATAETAF
jgi:hypothetical protein